MLFIIPLLLALCLNVSAVVLPRQTPCSFALAVYDATNNAHGTVVQDTVGENRIGGTYPQGRYYISQGKLIDGLGHNCVIMPSFQFQCILGSSGSTNFSTADDENLMQGDEEDWWACPAAGPGNDGSSNIFSYGLVNTTGCEAIALKTAGSNCTAGGRSSTSSPISSSSVITSAPTRILSSVVATIPTTSSSVIPSSSTFTSASSTSSAIASATPSVTCPTNISSGFQFPHLIVPTSPEAPDHAFGDSFSAYISPINDTIFNFDIPSTGQYNGTCALIFLFPFGGATYYSGIEEEEGENGGLDFASLDLVANADTTYHTTGPTFEDYGKVEVLPGNNYTITTFPCKSVGTTSFQVSSQGNVELDYFQQSGSNPMGLYIVPCDSACD